MNGVRCRTLAHVIINLSVVVGTVCGSGIVAVALPPDPANCTVSMPFLSAGTTVSVCVVPSGFGRPLTSAFRYGSPCLTSEMVNATIQVTWRDGTGMPVAPPVEACNVWIEPLSGALPACLSSFPGCKGGGTRADGLSVNSISTFTRAPWSGGHSLSTGDMCQVYYWDGTAKRAIGPPLAILFNSPDINGDNIVNLTDTVAFSRGVTSGVYGYSWDFWADCQVNLSDVAIYVQNLYMACP